MKKLTVQQWAHVLLRMTELEKQSTVDEKLAQFIELLRKKHATKLSARILSAFGRVWDEEHNVIRLETRSARELPESVETQLHTLGTEVIIDHTVDPHVIGGITIKMDDVIIDGTVATRLNKLYES